MVWGTCVLRQGPKLSHQHSSTQSKMCLGWSHDIVASFPLQFWQRPWEGVPPPSVCEPWLPTDFFASCGFVGGGVPSKCWRLTSSGRRKPPRGLPISWVKILPAPDFKLQLFSQRIASFLAAKLQRGWWEGRVEDWPLRGRADQELHLEKCYPEM